MSEDHLDFGPEHRRFLVVDHLEAVLAEAFGDRREPAVVVVHLEHGLADPRPIGFLDSVQVIELSALYVDLEEVPLFDGLLFEYFTERAPPASVW